MKKRISIKSEKNVCIVLVALAVYIMAQILSVFLLGRYMDTDITAVVLCGFGTMCIVCDQLRCRCDESYIFLAGYLLRILLVFSQVYLNGLLNVFVLCQDAEGFYSTAVRYFSGDLSGEYTKYPYVILSIFKVFGESRFMAQYINVIIWSVGWKLVQKMVSRHSKKMRMLAAFYYCLLPIGIFMTSELIRESALMVLIMYSFYYQCQWMTKGRGADMIKSFIIALMAVILHTVSIAMLGGGMLALLFWDPKAQRIRFTKRKVKYWLSAFFCACIFIGAGVFSRLPYFSLSSGGLSVEAVTGYAYAVGGSNYLMNVRNLTSMPQLLFWTPVRCVYFWLSPMIYDVRSVKDLVAVVLDVLPAAAMLYRIFKKENCRDGKYMLGAAELLLFTLMFAWGTSNAGTAMRHRNMLAGLMILTLIQKHSRFCNGSERGQGL